LSLYVIQREPSIASSKESSLFTDDTVPTVATAHCLLTGTGYAEAYHGGVPPAIEAEVRGRLPEDFLATIDAFYARFIKKAP
jgi:hypothetical protein